MWLTILIIVVIIGAIVGAVCSSDGERGEGAFTGAFAAGSGCLYIMFQIAIAVLSICFLIWIFGLLFG